MSALTLEKVDASRDGRVIKTGLTGRGAGGEET